MWSREFFGVDSYHLIQWFLVYSILGWMVESVYMSLCNRRLTNRGFVKGPVCPIYGFGALGVYFILRPFDGHYIVLYFMGALMATSFEFMVAKFMRYFFGAVWWDYQDKPFNYQGVVCLESTLAWGLYTILLFGFLQRMVERLVEMYSYRTGIAVMNIIAILFTIDLGHSLYAARKGKAVFDECED